MYYSMHGGNSPVSHSTKPNTVNCVVDQTLTEHVSAIVPQGGVGQAQCTRDKINIP